MKFNTSLSVLMIIGFVYPGAVRAVTDPVPSKIKLSDAVCVNTSPIFGQQRCGELKPQITDQLKKDISHVTASYYEGKLHFFSDRSADGKTPGFCVAKEVNKGVKSGQEYNVTRAGPVCNIGLGENDRNVKGQACGNYCPIDDDGEVGNMADCKREMSWFRGSYVQIWQSKLEKILDQIGADELQVHSVGKNPDGTDIRPCGSYAQAINDVLKGTKDANGKEQKGLTEVLNKLATLFRTNKNQISSDELKSCLTTDVNYADEKLAGRDLASIEAEALEEGRDIKGVKIKEKNYISQAACNLVFAHRQLQYLFLQLSRCEIMTQAEESHYAKFASTDLLFGMIDKEITQPCAKYAKNLWRATYDSDGNFTGWSCDKSCAAEHGRNCYKNGEGGHTPIASYLRGVYQATDPVRGVLGGHFEKAKAQKDDPAHNIKKGDEVRYPACLFLAPFVPLFRRGRRRGRNGGGMSKKVLRVSVRLIVILTVIAGVGCSKKKQPEGTCDDGNSFSVQACSGQWNDMSKKKSNCDIACSDACTTSNDFWSHVGNFFTGGLAHNVVCDTFVVPDFKKSLTAYEQCYDTQRKAACVTADTSAGGGSNQTSATLSPGAFQSLNNAQELFTDAGVITPPAKPDTGGSSGDTPSASAATEGGTFDKSETKGGTLADAGGNMKAPKFDMMNTKSEGAKGGAGGASNTGGSGTQAAKDEKQSALTVGAKTKEQIAYEAAGKGAGKQGSPFSGSKFGSDFDSAGKGVSAVGFSRDPAGAAAGAGTGEEDPETYLARAGSDSLFERVHPHFSRWGDQVQSGKWQSEFKRLGK